MAVLSDLERIHAIISSAYEKYVSITDRLPEPMLQDYGSRVQQGNVWVVGEPIVGLICLIKDKGSILIEDVAVLPTEQGKGIGKGLIAFAENVTTGLNLSKVRLYTNQMMVENIDFYRRLGYTEVERSIQDGYKRVFFEKTLIKPE